MDPVVRSSTQKRIFWRFSSAAQSAGACAKPSRFPFAWPRLVTRPAHQWWLQPRRVFLSEICRFHSCCWADCLRYAGDSELILLKERHKCCAWTGRTPTLLACSSLRAPILKLVLICFKIADVFISKGWNVAIIVPHSWAFLLPTWGFRHQTFRNCSVWPLFWRLEPKTASLPLSTATHSGHVNLPLANWLLLCTGGVGGYSCWKSKWFNPSQWKEAFYAFMQDIHNLALASEKKRHKQQKHVLLSFPIFYSVLK